jgi:HlyD family secretion protein
LKKRTRILLIVIGVTVLLALVVAGNINRKPAGEPVETKKAALGRILSKVTATGELKAQAQVNLQAQVMGVVAKLHVREGDVVRCGDMLLELDRRSYEANLVLARSRYNQARQSYVRVESLYQAKLVSDESYEAAGAAFEMAQAQHDEAQDQYNKTAIRAPITGTVAQVNIKEGETVIIGTMNNPGTVLMVIADMARMQAVIDVDETDIVTVEIGQPASVRVDALPDTSFEARVTKVGYMPNSSVLSSATQQATTFEVEVTLDSSAPVLRPGMNVHAEIVTAELDSVLTIPVQSAGRREVKGKETETVFIVRDGKAVLTPIRTGRASDTDLEILEGIGPGDEVITGPYKTLSKLTDGRRVTPRIAADTTGKRVK